MQTTDASSTRRWFEDGALHLGVGIEDTFIPQERVGQRKLDEYELTQHYHLWREDLDLAAASGATLIRWGIPWYLVEKDEGVYDFGWVDQVAARMRELGLRCVVDLMHYGTPLWLENGFLNPDYPTKVATYARAVAERYQGVFTDYTPLNEPLVNAIWCGRDRRWPPYLEGHSGFVRVLLPLAKGIVLAHRAILEVDPDATIVHVDAGFLWAGDHFPGLSHAELDEWRFLAMDLITGRVDAVHPMREYLLGNSATTEDLAWFQSDPVVPHVLGVNYYPAFTTMRFDPVTHEEIPVEAGAAGLVDLVGAYAQRYGLPVAVTETARATPDDDEKVLWVEGLFRAAAELRAAGVPLVAAFWFPMLDLVDWSYRDGVGPADDYMMRFGLVDLVRGPDNVLERRPNPAFSAFQDQVRAALA